MSSLRMDARREVCWEHLLPKEFEQAVAECPVCYMPLGTLERHGSHLPFGLDAMKAHGLCALAAQEHGGIVLPPLHWGTHGWWADDFRRGLSGKQPPGSVYIHEGLLMNLLLSMFREIEYAGFKVTVALTGHYPRQQVQALKNAAAQHMADGTAKVWALCEPELSGEVQVGADHAGKWETSIFWALYPELVDMDRCPDPDTGQFLYCSEEALEADPALGLQVVQYLTDKLGGEAARMLSKRDREDS